MKVELINREQAAQKCEELKSLAFAIAEVNGTLPGYCNAPECKMWMDYAALLSGGLNKPTERCVFIDGLAARQVFDNKGGIIPGAHELIGRMCADHLQNAELVNGDLLLYYPDGVIETYSFDEEIDAWRFLSKNISINVPSTSVN